ncbi:hypothetical protein HGRIS_010659 [Hohenbuehelia grisea]|uniref:Uncharacterized protein n=1 Tax=Hohenbuehelia grisea TaxID=104357 RepID=A0ABR3IXE0_9AGAR
MSYPQVLPTVADFANHGFSRSNPQDKILAVGSSSALRNPFSDSDVSPQPVSGQSSMLAAEIDSSHSTAASEPDSELKLPSRASLFVVVFGNALFQVGERKDMRQSSDQRTVAAFIFYHCLLSKRIRRISRRNCHIFGLGHRNPHRILWSSSNSTD